MFMLWEDSGDEVITGNIKCKARLIQLASSSRKAHTHVFQITVDLSYLFFQTVGLSMQPKSMFYPNRG